MCSEKPELQGESGVPRAASEVRVGGMLFQAVLRLCQACTHGGPFCTHTLSSHIRLAQVLQVAPAPPPRPPWGRKQSSQKGSSLFQDHKAQPVHLRAACHPMRTPSPQGGRFTHRQPRVQGVGPIGDEQQRQFPGEAILMLRTRSCPFHLRSLEAWQKRPPGREISRTQPGPGDKPALARPPAWL